MSKQFEWFQPSYGHGNMWVGIVSPTIQLQVMKGNGGRFFATVAAGQPTLPLGSDWGYETLEEAQAIAVICARLRLALDLKALGVIDLSQCIPEHQYDVGDTVMVDNVATSEGTLSGAGTITARKNDRYHIQMATPQYEVQMVETGVKWLLFEHDFTYTPRKAKSKVTLMGNHIIENMDESSGKDAPN